MSRERKNILKLTPTEQDNLITAWIGLQKRPPTDPFNLDPEKVSFYDIGTLHGQPFRGAGYGNAAWWGGYCNHGNVLFPTWHRAYIWLVEEALRTIGGCENVTMPYWDQVVEPLPQQVVPDIFLSKTYKYQDGTEVPNPLYSYTLQKGFTDEVSRPNIDYSKPLEYETVRYPYSGLVGPSNIVETKKHNATMDSYGVTWTNDRLNENVRRWLAPAPGGSDLRSKYIESLLAPNYTVYSNTTSASKWNGDKLGQKVPSPRAVVPIESPHNGMHLGVGGYYIPGQSSHDIIQGANGDMGENDTASFDPIFYFHHAFIDMMFWSWQTATVNTTALTIIDQYPGTNSVDSQGPTPGVPGGSWLTMDTPLEPFEDRSTTPISKMTSKKMTNIAASPLGYTYDTVVLRPAGVAVTLHDPAEAPVTLPYLRVSGISRASIAGSFVVSVWAKSKGVTTDKLVGFEPVLSRWHVTGCENCNTHLNVTVYLQLDTAILGPISDIREVEFTPVVYTSKSKSEDKDKWGHFGPGEKIGVVEPILPSE